MILLELLPNVLNQNCTHDKKPNPSDLDQGNRNFTLNLEFHGSIILFDGSNG
jgi:hypothetical protein